MEKRSVLLYKQEEKLKSMKSYLLLSVFVLFFCFSGIRAQKAENEPTFADKRQIIEALLKEKFTGSSEKTIYISTANLPDEIQNDLPAVKNNKIQFVSAETAANQGVCAYEFGKFEATGKFISVSFGDCSEGLEYSFKKFGNVWKSVGLTFER